MLFTLLRCVFLGLIVFATSSCIARTPPAATPAARTAPPPEPALTWHDVTTWGLVSRDSALSLPLYNGVDSLSVGVPPEARFEPLAPRTQKPIVFYGTSITHGASASRPGMVHTAILGRRLDRPVINLGFSGNGRMDAAVGHFLLTIDAAVL